MEWPDFKLVSAFIMNQENSIRAQNAADFSRFSRCSAALKNV